MSERYDHKKIEKKWQEKWRAAGIYTAQDKSDKPKTYVLDMFPYPSGEGLHVGHPKGYIATDIYSRHKRMQGHNVLHPMGWDAFGLPAENFAIKNKIHPRIAVEKNIAAFKEQLAGIGFDYDWSREINTTDPEYYKWTQWIFLQLFKKGLAYQSNEPINWCPSCMTGLANEDLDGNVCERCGTPVEKRALPQWVLKITAYADRMLADLDTLEWPEHIKVAQRNWIGRSEGAEIEFAVVGESEKIKVFTTRADTLFGATFLVLAPEHPLIPQLKAKIENWDEVIAYVSAATAKTEIERTSEGKEKTGVELKGVKAINPANQEEIPMFVADYVLGGYGTGAIMAVPAHDERDFAFAKKFNVPIRQVIMPDSMDADNATRDGVAEVQREMIVVLLERGENEIAILDWHGPEWGERKPVTLPMGGVDDGESVVDAAIREAREEMGYTDTEVIRVLPFKARSRYFAAHKNENRLGDFSGVVLRLKSEAQQSIDPDELTKHTHRFVSADIARTTTIGDSPRFVAWYQHDEPYTGSGILINSGQFDGLESTEAKKKITEFVGGSITSTYKIKDWVFSRQRYWGEPIPIIHCPKDGAVAVPEDQLPVLLPDVKWYEPSGTGESPLANITEWVNRTCPTCGGPAKRETNTMPQWAGSSWYYLRFMDPHDAKHLVDPTLEKYWAPVDVYVGGDHAVRHLIYARFWHKFLYDIGAVTTVEPFARLEFLGFILAEDGRKMSKRYGNVINPTDVVATYGADAFRIYEMFMGPFENTVAWSTASIAGTTRFVERIWRDQEVVKAEPVAQLEPLLQTTIQKVTQDINAFKFNTAVSQLMIFLNAVEKMGGVGKEQWESFLLLLAPFAPHTTDELWERLGYTESIHTAAWPAYQKEAAQSSHVSIAVQVNGRVRATLEIAPDLSEDEAVSVARGDKQVATWLAKGEVVKVIYVPGKVINFVLKGH